MTDEIISIRVDSKIKDRLLLESKKNSISINSLLGNMIARQLEWSEFVKQQNHIAMSKDLLRDLFDNTEGKKIIELAETIGKDAMHSMTIFIEGVINLESYLRALNIRLDIWNMFFKRFDENNHIRYVIQHDMGKKWALYLFKIMESLLKEIDCKITKEYLTEQNLSFTIFTPKIDRAVAEKIT